MITLKLPIIAPTLNEWYSGKHWTYRNKLKTLWQSTVWAEAIRAKVKPVDAKDYPVTITTQTFFPKKHYQKRDTSNCFTANKLAEDAIVKAGILPDDTTKYVGPHTVLPPVYTHDKGEGYTVVTISAGKDG